MAFLHGGLSGCDEGCRLAHDLIQIIAIEGLKSKGVVSCSRVSYSKESDEYFAGIEQLDMSNNQHSGGHYTAG